LATEKLKSHKSPGIDQIPAEMIKAGDIISYHLFSFHRAVQDYKIHVDMEIVKCDQDNIE
jgi:hypothetical protein